MRQIISISLGVLLLLALIPALAVAVGGGGGGSVPACTADVWSCGDWSSCSSAGQQTRSCMLSYDCSTATTPKPAEQQPCDPPKTSTNTNQAKTNSSVNQSKKVETTCTADIWTCSAWSDRCDTNGLQTRTCSISTECPSATTPSPETSRPCPTLQCGNLGQMRERILCRLNLAPAGVARELQIQYLPEECRALAATAEQNECISYYKSYQPCWSMPAGTGRFACARSVLKLGPIVSQEVQTCRGKTGTEQVQCKAELREKVFDFIKFRFYDLEQRAEEFGNRGADVQAIADFETAVEQQKQAFGKAATKTERRQIILNVREAWQQFINKVKDQIRT